MKYQGFICIQLKFCFNHGQATKSYNDPQNKNFIISTAKQIRNKTQKKETVLTPATFQTLHLTIPVLCRVESLLHVWACAQLCMHTEVGGEGKIT